MSKEYLLKKRKVLNYRGLVDLPLPRARKTKTKVVSPTRVFLLRVVEEDENSSLFKSTTRVIRQALMNYWQKLRL